MISTADLPPTLTVPEAAELLGCSVSAAYEAIRADDARADDDDRDEDDALHEAERPHFPVEVLRIGRKIVVPTQPLLELLGLADATELRDRGPNLSLVHGGDSR